MVTTRSKGLLYFGPEPNLVSQECLPPKGIIEALRSPAFLIVVINTTTKLQSFEYREVLGRPDDDLCTIVSAKASQKSSQDDQSLTTVK